ncbi:hypothetical protein EDD85DRAFT_853879 [Armillaria nabsnona]|nr:hypothetical protein EDD85DRAFT_853879 [Armillaria nabsnona]
MTSTTCKCILDEGRSAFVVSLDQQIERIDPLVPSPSAERELELCYRACVLLRPGYGPFLDHERVVDSCSNEQLKMVLYSMTSPEKASTALLGILQGPQRSSLTLHSAVWKALVDAAIPLPSRRGSGFLELELELMKVLASPLSTSKSGDVTTIDNPTGEMRQHTLHRLLTFWEYDRTEILVPVDSDQLLSIMLCLIPRIQHRLCNSVHASDRKDVIETSLAIIERTGFLIRPFASEQVIKMLCSLLSSEAFAIVGDLETLARKIFTILDDYREITPNTQFYSVAYQCYLRSLADRDLSSENDAMLPILERLQWSSENMSSNLSMPDIDSHKVLSLSNRSHHRAALFSTDVFFSVVLLLISRRNEGILYEWARHPLAHEIWLVCLPRLVQWAHIWSSVGSRQLVILKRVLAIAVIGKLRAMLGYPDEKCMPQYACVAQRDVIQFPWLLDVTSSGLDPGREPYVVKYSSVENHPNFEESFHSYLSSQENVENGDPLTEWTELNHSE